MIDNVGIIWGSVHDASHATAACRWICICRYPIIQGALEKIWRRYPNVTIYIKRMENRKQNFIVETVVEQQDIFVYIYSTCT